MTQQLGEIETRIANGWQKSFPLVARPYAQIAEDLGIGENEVIEALATMKENGILGRVGAVVRPNTVGASSLVAMRIPPAELEAVAEKINQEPCVNHNYERENELNLWFVVTAGDEQELDIVLERIERETGYGTVKLPLEKAYHIDLGFQL